MPSTDVTVILFDPAGGQVVLHGRSDGTGTLNMALQPAASPWQVGVYRAVVALPRGQAISATFLANDGGEHLAVRPDLPSPNSALIISGLGLPANVRIHLVLTLAGGLGQRDVSATTDASGGLSTLVWPQAIGFDFLSAGRYELQAPELGLDTAFYVREHPSTSFIHVPGTVASGADEQIGLTDYGVDRYLWARFTKLGADSGGEILAGPTDARGSVQAMIRFPDLPPGEYMLGTP
ncbi:MAG TPA: hypothetical protein VF221_20140, partial [Chloroflexota bacterium]